MTDILDGLRAVQELGGDTYSSYEVLGLVGRAADEIERLRVENAGMTEAVAVLRAIVEAIDRREPKITGWLERARAALEGK